MFSRWCLIFGVTLIAFTMHSYGRGWGGSTDIGGPELPKPDTTKWDNIEKGFEADREKSKQESAERSKKMDKDHDNVKKGMLTVVILAIVLPIVACVLLLICCGVTIGVTICCVCKKKKNEKK